MRLPRNPAHRNPFLFSNIIPTFQVCIERRIPHYSIKSAKKPAPVYSGETGFLFRAIDSSSSVTTLGINDRVQDPETAARPARSVFAFLEPEARSSARNPPAKLHRTVPFEPTASQPPKYIASRSPPDANRSGVHE